MQTFNFTFTLPQLISLAERMSNSHDNVNQVMSKGSAKCDIESETALFQMFNNKLKSVGVNICENLPLDVCKTHSYLKAGDKVELTSITDQSFICSWAYQEGEVVEVADVDLGDKLNLRVKGLGKPSSWVSCTYKKVV